MCEHSEFCTPVTVFNYDMSDLFYPFVNSHHASQYLSLQPLQTPSIFVLTANIYVFAIRLALVRLISGLRIEYVDVTDPVKGHAVETKTIAAILTPSGDFTFYPNAFTNFR